MANEPSLVSIKTWREYCRLIDERLGRQQSLLFRGHADVSWQLASVWERFLLAKRQAGDTTDARHVRDRKLEAFREQCRAVGHALPSSDMECWAIGRHFGLVTPLLDWTTNPYIAAFFACLTRYEMDNPDLGFWGAIPQNWGKNPVAIWELREAEVLSAHSELHLITGVSAEANRQRAQSGVFTFLDHPEYADLETYLIAHGKGDHLTRYVLSGAVFKDAFVDLTRRNINYGTIYPDVMGAAKQANIHAVTQLFTVIHSQLTSRFNSTGS